jgi:hypothetical protein
VACAPKPNLEQYQHKKELCGHSPESSCSRTLRLGKIYATRTTNASSEAIQKHLNDFPPSLKQVTAKSASQLGREFQ